MEVRRGVRSTGARVLSYELLNVGAGDRGYCQEKKVFLTTRPSS